MAKRVQLFARRCEQESEACLPPQADRFSRPASSRSTSAFVAEYTFHFRSVLAAEIEREEPQQKTIGSLRAIALFTDHRALYACRGARTRRVALADARSVSMRSLSATATCLPNASGVVWPPMATVAIATAEQHRHHANRRLGFRFINYPTPCVMIYTIKGLQTA